MVGSERGRRKSVHNVGVGVDRDDDNGLSQLFDVGCSTPYFSMKKYGWGMIDVYMLLD